MLLPRAAPIDCHSDIRCWKTPQYFQPYGLSAAVTRYARKFSASQSLQCACRRGAPTKNLYRKIPHAFCTECYLQRVPQCTSALGSQRRSAAATHATVISKCKNYITHAFADGTRILAQHGSRCGCILTDSSGFFTRVVLACPCTATVGAPKYAVCNVPADVENPRAKMRTECGK